ncbi:hypothetical protein Tco_0439372 [Tanacetum coccineum]
MSWGSSSRKGEEGEGVDDDMATSHKLSWDPAFCHKVGLCWRELILDSICQDEKTPDQFYPVRRDSNSFMIQNYWTIFLNLEDDTSEESDLNLHHTSDSERTEEKQKQLPPKGEQRSSCIIFEAVIMVTPTSNQHGSYKYNHKSLLKSLHSSPPSAKSGKIGALEMSEVKKTDYSADGERSLRKSVSVDDEAMMLLDGPSVGFKTRGRIKKREERSDSTLLALTFNWMEDHDTWRIAGEGLFDAQTDPDLHS